MFLTTNRIVNFDAAFQSRIHLAIKYPGLSESSQRQLWTTFITNDSRNPQPDWLDEMLLDDLATRKLNGRQIRNVVRTAMALAVVESRSLEPQDIYTSLEAMEDFGRDFAAAVHDEPVAGNRDDPYSYESHSAPGNRQKRRRIE
jgi:SpoVK/Ycf46/Vps4 family AAA+-type ATPase